MTTVETPSPSAQHNSSRRSSPTPHKETGQVASPSSPGSRNSLPPSVPPASQPQEVDSRAGLAAGGWNHRSHEPRTQSALDSAPPRAPDPLRVLRWMGWGLMTQKHPESIILVTFQDTGRTHEDRRDGGEVSEPGRPGTLGHAVTLGAGEAGLGGLASTTPSRLGAQPLACRHPTDGAQPAGGSLAQQEPSPPAAPQVARLNLSPQGHVTSMASPSCPTQGACIPHGVTCSPTALPPQRCCRHPAQAGCQPAPRQNANQALPWPCPLPHSSQLTRTTGADPA